MEQMKFCCPTLFGLEGIVADELRFGGGLTDVQAENGRVFFTGDARTLAWANLNLRCGERVLLLVGAFEARSFDELFERARALPWEGLIPKGGMFPIKGHSLESALHSVPDCQRILKKAVARRLSEAYGMQWLEETGARYQIQFSIMHDRVELYLDTTGAGLHKRGYRAQANLAPLRETLAAAMVKLARWRGRDTLLDPFCGSGTILIEAAMIAMKRAPGLMRSFEAEQWAWLDSAVWREAREEAHAAYDHDACFPILGSDIDPACVELTQHNAEVAGVGHTVRAEVADATRLSYRGREGVLFANPPYGERMLDIETARQLYAGLGRAMRDSPMRRYILSSDLLFERFYGRRADKRRKLYNGMIKCDLYMYFKDGKKQPEKPSAKAKDAKKQKKMD